MVRLASAVWLMLFWLPGCVLLRGPSSMTGTVGESLRVQCQYEEKHKAYSKYWCRVSRLRSCQNTVKTRASKEARNGRVSIRDDPATLTFTVTLDNLTLEDAGTYMCGITPSLGIDSYSKVVVSVVPDKGPSVLTTSLATEGPTEGSTMKEHLEHSEPTGLSLPVLLSVLALLLFLLAGASLLVWRMFQKRQVKGTPRMTLDLVQAAEQSECQYVNLQLHTWPLREEPEPPSQVEVEYSTVMFPKEELHYASVAFDSQRQGSHANGNSPCLPQDQKAEYSEVRKPREGLSDPHL
uniref:CD300A molecule n=1 Tax=Cricetulus griseus TaxID=10029 RepID=A0A8C2M6T9_CRIGR